MSIEKRPNVIQDAIAALRGKNDNGDKDLRIIILFVDPKTIIVTAIDKNKKED